ncbi:BTB/POZ domain and ankyrin repeat-containing protein NPR1 [Dendrobium catenatum]|uniref:Regulatory protein NPR1 n=1 Tax=Dendrobium catenatum TaxID=906689 RepID=A0A2I0WF37_9ASPA|nr:BTB/POZ domain and ankyrin repeat-containing protein NPR1 [Dendrobium catenatum]PKU74276.1 Regulatory protein NPR1 [Dendrobium catenatum]
MISTAQLPAFSDSDNGSSIQFADAIESHSPEIESLRRLSDHLLYLLQSPDFDFFSDARIAVGAKELAVHRCLLSARSSFFRDVFAGKEKAPDLPVRVEMKELVGDKFDVGFEALVLVIDYLYSGRVGQLPKDVCMCADDECAHVGCRPSVGFMLEVLFASFTFKISELVSLFQRHLLDIIDKIAIDEIPLILCVAKFCNIACERLLIKCVEIVVKSDIHIVTLEKVLPLDIVNQVMETRSNLGLRGGEGLVFPDKHVRRIYRALDSDDIELVKMLLTEGPTSLDDAYALHYAVAHCDTKITMELLDYGHADVNHVSPRGYSVLHVAAMRKEPKIIVSLLTKGARPSDLTLDGRKAVQISKRITKYVDYCRNIEGRASLEEGRLCIGILEHAEKRNPLVGEVFSLAMAGNDQHGILLYLENRVALARMLFPMEAKVAMEIAHVDGTLEFTLGTTANPRSTVDLNKEPFKIKEEHLARIKALSTTVKLGKRFFPRCSEYLDKIMDDDNFDLSSVGHNNASVEQMKRYLELQDDINRAFTADKEKLDKSALSSPSSSSTSAGIVRKRNRVCI